MGKAKWFFSASGCILLVCALAMSGKGINFGIDFDGGARITAPLERAATVDQVRDTIAPLGLADAKIQTLDNETLGAERRPDLHGGGRRRRRRQRTRLDGRLRQPEPERRGDRPELR